ncbi:MAG: ComEC/Rec2 family competence protein, partial [Acidobacteria bacterium]|nr:ComEC/Rec2 family competence protein [Acidobacteriota bacterium]
PAFFDDRERFVAELEPGARARVAVPGTQLRLEYGRRVEFDARISTPRNFRNPGSFDYVRWLARQDIYWNLTVVQPPALRVLPGRCGSRFQAFLFRLRGLALERIERQYPADTYHEAMLKAILIGDNTRLEKVWTEVYRRTGTYHAIVISGLHIGVLAGILLFLLRLAAVNELVALAATALAAWLYALVAGWQAPVIRAAAGFFLYLVARFFYRRTRILNLLAAVAIGFLVCDPQQMFEASFQLSFLSVAALGALAAPLLEATSSPLLRGLRGLADADRDPHVEPRVAQFRIEVRLAAELVSLAARVPLRWCAAALAVPLRALLWAFEMAVVSASVQLGLALPLVIYFHRLSFLSVPANLLIVPLLTAVVPAGFAAVFTGWRFPAWLARVALDWSRAVAEWHSRLEPAWRVPAPPLWLAVAFVAALVWLAWRTPWGRAVRVTLVLALLAILVWHPFAPRLLPGWLELAAIDVGQAESLLLATPQGKTVLIDAGGFPSWIRRSPGLDIGEDVVSPYLWTRSIRRLDVVVCTHAHSDHAGGLGAILENFRPRELWINGGDEWAPVAARAQALGVRVVRRGAGEKFFLGGAEFEVLWAPAHSRPAEPENDDSLVLRVRHGAHSFLLTGDIQRDVEYRLLDAGLVTRSEVLKVAHHGSRTSSSAAFLEAVRPAFAVISASYASPYWNPHPDVLARLRSRHAAVHRTDQHGLILLRTNGRRLHLENRGQYTQTPFSYPLDFWRSLFYSDCGGRSTVLYEWQ